MEERISMERREIDVVDEERIFITEVVASSTRDTCVGKKKR